MKKLILILLLISACGGQSIKELSLEKKVWCQDSLLQGFVAAITVSVNPSNASEEGLNRYREFKLIYEEATGKDVSALSFEELAYLINIDRYTLADVNSVSISKLNIFKRENLSEKQIEICEAWYKAFR
tara:strand:- start:912 stop:1298 length:387 start_codon:yes stop_codon:yes gene_type:complete